MSVAEPAIIGERISILESEGVADVRLIRTDRMNALDGAMFEALAECLERLNHSDARVVVLSGAGRAFCAGLDMTMFDTMMKGGVPDGIPQDLARRTHGIANLPQHVAMGWRALPMPVIAAVHGAAFGGGLQLTLGADIRLVAPDARLALREIQWGLVPDMAAFVFLPSLLRDDRLRHILYTGSEMSGAQAVEWGLATECAEAPYEAAMALAKRIAAASPSAVRAAKRLANAAMRDPRELLFLESLEQQHLIGNSDQQALLAARLPTGRAPSAASTGTSDPARA